MIFKIFTHVRIPARQGVININTSIKLQESIKNNTLHKCPANNYFKKFEIPDFSCLFFLALLKVSIAVFNSLSDIIPSLSTSISL